MNKNLILALVLSSIVYIVWFTYITPPPKIVNKKNISQNKEITGDKNKAETIISDASKIDVIKSKKENEEQKQKDYVILETSKSKIFINQDNGSINQIIYEGPISPVKLILKEVPGFLNCLDALNYKVSKKEKNLLVLQGKISNDISLIKKIDFKEENNINSLNLTFENKSNKSYEIPPFELYLGPGLGTVKSEEKENPKIWEADYTFQEPNKKHPTISKIKNDIEREDWIWTGINNRYFLFAVINENNFSKIKYSSEKIDEHNAPSLSILTKPVIIAPKSQKTIEIKFYAGPKDYILLKKIGYGLDRAVDFGFFAPLAKIANSALQYFHNITGNYGIAIIILSIILQIIIFPLGLKSYKAMAIMKKIQPEMQAIQAKYKNEPQKMNAEIMQLYKKYGANPLSGCWPMLLQIPIFFALFTALRNSWNLHGATFIFWIKDLSAKDPYYILPLLMGGLMFFQQHLTPQTSGDQMQAKMMKWMPVIFTFMFLSFPSGLVLYWIINSLFSIAQNLYLKKNEEEK